MDLAADLAEFPEIPAPHVPAADRGKFFVRLGSAEGHYSLIRLKNQGDCAEMRVACITGPQAVTEMDRAEETALESIPEHRFRGWDARRDDQGWFLLSGEESSPLAADASARYGSIDTAGRRRWGTLSRDARSCWSASRIPGSGIPTLSLSRSAQWPRQVPARLHDAVGQHRVGHFGEAGDIRAQHIVALPAIGFRRFVAGLMDALHDQEQPIVHFLAGP